LSLPVIYMDGTNHPIDWKKLEAHITTKVGDRNNENLNKLRMLKKHFLMDNFSFAFVTGFSKS
jgi:hypothetical protein